MPDRSADGILTFGWCLFQTMSVVKFPDAGGCSMTLMDVDGRYLTASASPDHWHSLRTMKTRCDDVYICSYPKSGFHWIWEIVAMLRSGASTPIQELMEGHITDFMKLDDLERQASPRTLTTHRYSVELPEEIFHMGFPFNSWWEHIKRWSAMKVKYPETPLLVVSYEDMKQDPVGGIKRLAAFLEVDVAEDVINNIAKNTEFTTMKSAKEQLENKLVSYYKCGKEIMYRKGEVGDWKHWFTGARNKEFEDFINTKLQGSHFSALVSPDRYPWLRTTKFGHL
ncbi:sulfotransferase 1C2-like isoform X3 [Haliotis cracherodii]|uniref:sulfotransferase 1C2-like isoform X3 n=1 Tax=Haliotis cracherodii TaxID=6455 RepID=UPI0039EC6AFD